MFFLLITFHLLIFYFNINVQMAIRNNTLRAITLLCLVKTQVDGRDAPIVFMRQKRYLAAPGILYDAYVILIPSNIL